MGRRRFVTLSLFGAGMLLAGAGGGLAWLRSGPGARVLTVEAALQKIDALGTLELGSTGAWNPHQIFSHCAQTIEYSMAGYPAPKSKLFMDTAGKFAFAIFSSQKKMKHGLSEPVAGAPALAEAEAEADAVQGLARLRQAFLDFQQFDGVLAPHFAYGTLSKDEYALAHVLHFSNHLEQIKRL